MAGFSFRETAAVWKNFDPTPYTRETFEARVERLPALPWCKGITFHNTAAPTLKQWVEFGPAHAARLRNLQSFYEKEKGWHAGPHLFVSRDFINGFSDLTKPGVHSRCFNATHIGIEMVGDYNVEQFDSGDGAKVRDNAVYAAALLCRKLGLDPATDINIHKDCKRDNHDCPGQRRPRGTSANVPRLVLYFHPAIGDPRHCPAQA
jgi:hypothetical protein